VLLGASTEGAKNLVYIAAFRCVEIDRTRGRRVLPELLVDEVDRRQLRDTSQLILVVGVLHHVHAHAAAANMHGEFRVSCACCEPAQCRAIEDAAMECYPAGCIYVRYAAKWLLEMQKNTRNFCQEAAKTIQKVYTAEESKWTWRERAEAVDSRWHLLDQNVA
jgi:hypothetical protein